ncbi:TIGR03790 family protein [Pseudoduganella sp. GCM10020061]|uniref:TIGR03790 family protein n=1 Tax=Pseudoduganella sp. GCM10020061 TaxID=3317345 RepID=UPI003640EBBB
MAVILVWACGMGSAWAQVTMGAGQLGLVINDADPASIAVGDYYRKARGVPAENVVHVRIPPNKERLELGAFRQMKADIDKALPPHVQAVLMVWTAPYAVDCNSITAAYTLGYDAAQCAKTCGQGRVNPYFNSPAKSPSAAGLRLSMLLPANSVESAKALIDRGIAADRKAGPASAYFLTTSEKTRNSRAHLFPPAGRIAAKKLTIKRLSSDALENASDIMFYQTGLARVNKIETNKFLPGALADHMTSLGGDLLGNGQMSALRWLEAGATASYGTVTEPCNYWQKFPHPTVLMRHYALGATAIEAYWKSVAWPAQGLFIGEPLAAPYKR